ncbi:membrane-bound inhibitor of C-type lysozyme [Sphingopyxis sp. OAS728]|uniref:MliC family protein n=1 Tax=Sphingopyxis sp. OAS728 TaxID=2663823 RepID=UPI0017897332|nr:MliC family protein [Sphingopyxis sp. OAS728]MBE1528131.1 membrane-bound inhibitor of C-type lysozyme [Sphingopyxis sp. OAS728]
MKTTTLVAAGAAILALAACSSVPRNTGTSYDCSGGTKLKVDYVGNTAIVRVNGMRSMVLKQTPSNSGQIYENKSGARLHRNGNDVTWNTALRSAPESCRVVYTPM